MKAKKFNMVGNFCDRGPRIHEFALTTGGEVISCDDRGLWYHTGIHMGDPAEYFRRGMSVADIIEAAKFELEVKQGYTREEV